MTVDYTLPSRALQVDFAISAIHKFTLLKALTHGIYMYIINKLPHQLPRSSDVCVYGGRPDVTYALYALRNNLL